MILASLQASEWLPGDAIPSEMELAARYAVSQGTVRKAIDELAAQNLLVRRQGKGTFVATHQEEGWQYRFLRLETDSGEKLHLKNQFLACEYIQADAHTAELLKLKVGDPIIRIDRVQSSMGKPIVFIEIVGDLLGQFCMKADKLIAVRFYERHEPICHKEFNDFTPIQYH